MWRALPILILTLSILLLTPRNSIADPFTTTDVLRIDFKSPGYPSSINALLLEIGSFTVLEPVRGFTAILYDGSRVLGTNSLHLFDGVVGPLNLFPSNIWAAPGTRSIHPALPQTTIDFDAITQGTIAGRIDFTVGAGAIAFELANVRLHAWEVRPDGLNFEAIAPTILSVNDSPVPEPGTLLLVLTGFVAAGTRRRYSSRRVIFGGNRRLFQDIQLHE